VVKLQAVFPSAAAANRAAAELRQAYASPANGGPARGSIGFGTFEGIVLQNAGTPLGNVGAGSWQTASSSSRRELFLYGYQQRIYDRDLVYLHERDAIVRAINTKPPRDAWLKPPITNVSPIDDFFARLRRLGFFEKARAAHTYARKLRYCFLYINAGGDAGEPIEEGGSMWHGFQLIHPSDIDWERTVYDHENPAYSDIYGIEKLAVVNSNGVRYMVHSSRLIAFVEDDEADHPTKARPKIAACYDSVWNRRDYEFMLRQSITEGNPYVITVDTDALEAGHTLEDDEAEAMQTEAKEVRSAARDSFGPLEHTTVTRVGAADLDDPEWGLRVTTGSIAVAQEMTSNMLMIFSRGSEQVTDADRNDYSGNIRILRETFVWPRLDRVINLGRESGYLGSKRGVQLPMDVEWPQISTMPEREDAFVLARHAATLQAITPLGYLPPPRIARLFKKDPNFKPAEETKPIPTVPGKGAPPKAQAPEDEDKEWKQFQDDVRGEPDEERRKKPLPE